MRGSWRLAAGLITALSLVALASCASVPGGGVVRPETPRDDGVRSGAPVGRDAAPDELDARRTAARRMAAALPDATVVSDRAGDPAALEVSVPDGAGIAVRYLAIMEDEDGILAAWTTTDGSVTQHPMAPDGAAVTVARVRESGNDLGFVIDAATIDAERRLFVLVGPTEPLVVETTLSGQVHTRLADLNGDGRLEFIRVSQVFQPDGTREHLVEALERDAGGLRRVAGLALLRAVNTRLADLEQLLTAGVSTSGGVNVDRALTPMDGAPSASRLVPAVRARVPRLVELAVPPGELSWRFAHEIALDSGRGAGTSYVYLIRVEVEANPFVDDPVRILGLDTES